MLGKLFLVLGTALVTALLLGKFSAWRKIAIAAMLLYPVVILTNILSYLWVFNRIEDSVLSAGWMIDPYLRKATVSILAFGVYAVIPLMIRSVAKADAWGTAATLSLVYWATNILLFAVSRPNPNQVVNPNTGDYLYKYFRNPEAKCVERFPRHFDFHPNRLQVKLMPPDVAIVEEWLRRPCAEQDKAFALPKADDMKPARHRFKERSILFEFESCQRGTAGIFCTFAIRNTGEENETITLYPGVDAVDSDGNKHLANDHDFAGLWARESFLWWRGDICQTCDLKNALLSPNITLKFHVGFERVPQEIGRFQNLRMTFCCTGLLQRDDRVLDFREIPITKQVSEAPEKPS